jgi:large-conductance mechanosensitive channel
MANISPVSTGAALAVTVGIGYSACALVFWLWPEAAATFMNALFHGLDFRKLQSGPMLFEFGSFIYALVVMLVWAFALGATFSWINGRFGNGR